MKIRMLTKRELQIMQILWNSATALSVREITSLSDNLSQNTVQAVLRKLLSEHVIEVDGIGQSGTVHTRNFIASLSQEDYFKKIMSPSALKNLVSHFIESTTETSEIDELASLVREKQKDLRKNSK
ncbi:hypothetical protein CPZ13_11555 [Lacticaseibacillus paracasei]|uniref:BlaI/MecI/CopY family transcriptional regulator n=1 Tax=Lacticaseibacillus paracasei TaxID=1597 RepID=UPI0008A5E75B|nr:BlaI/MecI/CopY family transcriptional regulator [Lacticaseibacillus paracasei]OFP86694.1 hypothetical protein HMPREF2969_04765 [Lactobacillus sp. HMSC056D05]PCL22582.1 hypothetical protein CPZ14_12090 [Lacticaseibacillus paracasei]PCL33384.1 hypothetical protein CPZ13_11555 [Lacticaseibacillus paracasei]WRM19157.1 BlaI/MecI/CopY family transcriptional regulator [Lacticaseibacillus paracasei]